MKQQRSRIAFKALLVVMFMMLAIYAGLFLAYQQLLHETNLYAEQFANMAQVAVVATLAP
jgi:hypothetical protein